MSTGNLRMPRVHELNIFPEEMSRKFLKDFEEEHSEVSCFNCKESLDREIHWKDLDDSPEKDKYICNLCSVDVIATAIVNQILLTALSKEVDNNDNEKCIFNSSQNSIKNLCKINVQEPSVDEDILNEDIQENDYFLKIDFKAKEDTSKGSPSSKLYSSNNNIETTETIIEFCTNVTNFQNQDFERQSLPSLNQSQVDFVDQAAIDPQNQKTVPIHHGKGVSEFYKNEKLLGKGKFGEVLKVSHKITHDNRAVKVIKYRSEETKRSILNEIEILECLLGSDHIMTLIEVLDDFQARPKTMNLVSEYLEGGELFDQIAKDELLTEQQVIEIMGQILNGANFIHEHGIIHRDLKPENLVYTSNINGHLKIIDFGFAVKYNPQKPPKSMVGTTIFVAPEVLRFENQNYSTDMWSIGVIAYNLLAGITPFEIPTSGDPERILSDHEIIENIERCKYNFDDEGFIEVSENAKNFISGLLIRNPSQRMSANECLNHIWLSSLCKNKTGNISRSISLKRMKNYVALKRWRKANIAIQSVNYLKSSILPPS